MSNSTATPVRQSAAANLRRTALAELIGTYLLVLVGTAVVTAAILGRNTAGAGYNSLAVALAFGLTLTALAASLGHTSGCHVNPAVTIGLAAIGRFPWRSVPAYVGAQIVGAVLASFTIWAAYGPTALSKANLGETAPASGVNGLQAFLMEAIIGFLLVFVVVAVTTDERVPAGIGAIAIGFALACGVLVAGPVSGGAANPARALGPMLVTLSFPAVYAYVLGPIAGGVLGALAYDRIIRSSGTPTPDRYPQPQPQAEPCLSVGQRC